MRHMNVLIGDMGGTRPLAEKRECWGRRWGGWVEALQRRTERHVITIFFVSNDRNEDVVDKTHGGKKNDEQKERDDGTRSSHTQVAKR